MGFQREMSLRGASTGHHWRMMTVALKSEWLHMVGPGRAVPEGSDLPGFQPWSRRNAPMASSNRKSCDSSTMFRQVGRIRDRHGPSAEPILRRPGKPPGRTAIFPFVRYFLATGLVELCVWTTFHSPPTRRNTNVS